MMKDTMVREGDKDGTRFEAKLTEEESWTDFILHIQTCDREFADGIRDWMQDGWDD